MDTRYSVVGIAGWGTTIALIVSLVNALSPDNVAQSPASPASNTVRAQEPKRPDLKQPRDPHVVVTGRLLLDRFYGDTDRATRRAPRPYELGVLFITVPDPVDSHLDWAYDAQLNATRRALERDGYVIDRFWVPWRSTRDTTSGSGQSAALTVRAHHPGVMLFRKSTPRERRLRLIYLVGEIPTAGIHKLALISALNEADSLLRHDRRFVRDTSMGDEVRIVGPTFSGSAASLRLAIDEWRACAGCGKRAVRIITGTASNTRNPEFFRGENITFTATVYDDRSLGAFEEQLLTGRMGIAPSEIAILREASTQYGQLSIDDADSLRVDASRGPSTRKDRGPPIEIPFAMNISELREEYARNPDQLIIGHDMPGEPRAVRLPVKLGEGARLSDGPPVVSELTPPAVDAMLDDIAQSLNAHHIKAAGILATDARDVIFLGTELRKRVHDVVLFTYGSNVLYARPDVSQWLRGMLVVSTYPVSVESQFWDITQRGRMRMPFPGDMSEGMYNAVLMQLGGEASTLVTDYAPPLSRATTPDIWVTTVGTSSMLPVTLLQSAGAGSETSYVSPRKLPAAGDSDASALLGQQEGTGSKSDSGFLIIVVGIGFALLLHDQLDWRRSVRVRRDGTRLMRPTDVMRHVDGLRASLSPDDWRSNWNIKHRIAETSSLLFQHEMYTILRVVSLTVAFVATLFLLLRARSHASADQRGMEIGIAVSLLAGLFVVVQSFSFIGNIAMVVVRPLASYYYDPHGWPTVRSWILRIVNALGSVATFLIGGTALVAILLLAYDVATLSPVALQRLFFFRSTAITGGVSPGIPLLIAGALFYAWCIWNCKRVALLLKSTAFEQLFFAKVERSPGRPPGDGSSAVPKHDGPPSHDNGSGRGPINNPGAAETVPRHEVGVSAGMGQQGGTAVVDAPPSTVAHGLDMRNLTPHSSTPVIEQPHVMQAPDSTERRQDASPRTDAELGAHVRQVRARLSLSLPGVEGVVVFLALGFLFMWGWSQFNRTIDALVLPPSLLLGEWRLTNFDLLLRLGTLGAMAVTMFVAFRLVRTWLALRDALRDLGEMSLLYAFDGLPLPVARLTRLGLGHQPSDSVIAGAVRREWLALDRLNASPLLAGARAAVQMPHGQLRARDSVARSNAVGARPAVSRPTTLLDLSLGSRLTQLFTALEAAWIAWPAALDAVSAHVWNAKESIDHAEHRRGSAPAVGTRDADDPGPIQRAQEKWLLVAGQCSAVYVVEYIEWVIHHLRNLAAFLITAIVLVNALLASYPFQPQSALKAVFLGVTMLAVGGLVYVLLQMNRDDVLSLITKTDPGRVNWSGPFALNLALYILVPLAALLSTEFPFIREFLFSWVKPSLRALGKG